MSHTTAGYTTLDDWISREAMPIATEPAESFDAAVGQLIGSLGDSVELLGLGEALHGSEDILILRNRLFQRLVEARGYSAIAVESSFPRARVINEYVAGRGPNSYEAVQETGFSHGFGRLAANRELVEWMRRHNADLSHRVKVQFYGFDTPTEMTGTDSPRHIMHFVLDYLDSIDRPSGQERRRRIETLLGQDADWENPAAMMNPTESVGLSPSATALRLETDDLISEFQRRRPELVAKSDASRYRAAAHDASLARWLLSYHAAIARPSESRLVDCLGMRDGMMADNLAYIVSRERGRGKVLAFAHNSHVKCGQARWQLGPQLLVWWPAGAHLQEMFGPRYAVIGSGVGVSAANGIGPPEAGTLEALLTTVGKPALFLPTHKGQGLPAAEVAALPTRSGSVKNMSYFPFTPQSVTDYDGLLFLHSSAYNRGGPPLP
jgi:erythromycin esterase-like protein